MAEEYYYNLVTGEVEKGRAASAHNRMGPYSSPEAARHAMEKAQARNESWEEDDEAWDFWEERADDE
ncbi:MAG: hypothetical protein Q4P36_01030 [Bowdeniella nasicola]|nr:hypothetical protein [Bowdeniella nasicola]